MPKRVLTRHIPLDTIIGKAAEADDPATVAAYTRAALDRVEWEDGPHGQLHRDVSDFAKAVGAGRPPDADPSERPD